MSVSLNNVDSESYFDALFVVANAVANATEIRVVTPSLDETTVEAKGKIHTKIEWDQTAQFPILPTLLANTEWKAKAILQNVESNVSTSVSVTKPFANVPHESMEITLSLIPAGVYRLYVINNLQYKPGFLPPYGGKNAGVSMSAQGATFEVYDAPGVPA